ncbi:hypothetical protein PF010_g19968 [Phytophthora fragariae]|uniref:Uncharacterized protein n=1 Tax=Phytophthora fragariae TaxID=53985 RepID=A0A6G0NAJ3_9STRA|nr:hypothetical protein PF010_g19968 [Phytophthora fragariae]KAE9198885.1 hypothetical protein PF004_g19425 [Phytophthora fragariae]
MTLAILYHEKVKRSQEKVGGASVLIIACVAYSKLRSLQGQVAQEGGAVLGEDGEAELAAPERCVRRVRGVLREDGEAELAAPS